MFDNREMMRAVQQTEWGGLEKLTLVEVPRPAPLPTEVLVRVKAAGINPVDFYTVQGKAYMRALNLPYIPGWDIAGDLGSRSDTERPALLSAMKSMGCLGFQGPPVPMLNLWSRRHGISP